MSVPPVADRKLNFYSGLAALALVVLVSGYAIVNKLMSIPVEEPHVYVAYFENSGGLREGDRVRIQGRSAGKVNKVEVVNHNGKIVSRVEFEITPGTGSTWLTALERAGGIPSDSTIGVKMPSFMGRPILVITIGKDDVNPIGEGGEWVHTASANEADQLSQWGEDIDRGREQIAKFIEFFDDREQFDKLNQNLGDIADQLEKTDKAMTGFEGRGAEIADGIEDAKSGMDEMRESLHGSGETAAKQLPELAEQASAGAEQMDKVSESLTRAMEEVQRLSDSMDDTVSDLEKSNLDKLGLELRRLSSRLRAGMELAEADPKQFGDMPNWRKSRGYFQGGEPSSGTSIDEPAPEAPSEKVGVPSGQAVPKRGK